MRKILTFFVMFLTVSVFALPAAVYYPIDGTVWGIFDQNGFQNSGGTIRIYNAGTTDDRDCYTTYSGTAASNPLTLDSLGQGDLYTEAGWIKIEVKDDEGTTVFTQDWVPVGFLGSQATLEVNYLEAFDGDGIKFQDDAQIEAMQIYDGGRIVINEDGNDTDFRVEGNVHDNVLYVDAGTDRLGVGTSTPDASLEVEGDVQFDGGSFIFNEDSGDYDFRIEGNGNANLFYTDAGNDRVGIGTATPATLLNMVSTTDAILEIGAGNDDDVSRIVFDQDGTNVGFISAYSADWSVAARQSDLEFWNNNATGEIKFCTDDVNPAVTITNDGKVGIGTASPTKDFVVGDDLGACIGSATSMVLGDSDGSTGFAIGQETERNLQFRWNYDATPANAYGFIQTYGGSNDLVLQRDGGNVGIGDSTPSYTLELAVDSAAKPSTNTWTVPSDERIKKNIKTMENALDTVCALRGVTYEYNDVKYPDIKGTQRGMIAQEVMEVIPEWVKQGEDGYYSLSIGGFEGLAAEAIKELVAKIQELEARIKALEE